MAIEQHHFHVETKILRNPRAKYRATITEMENKIEIEYYYVETTLTTMGRHEKNIGNTDYNWNMSKSCVNIVLVIRITTNADHKDALYKDSANRIVHCPCFDFLYNSEWLKNGCIVSADTTIAKAHCSLLESSYRTR